MLPGLLARLAHQIYLGACAHQCLIHRDWEGSNLEFSVLASDFVTYCSNEQLQSGGETWKFVSKEIMGSECVLDKSTCGSLWRVGNSKHRNTSRLADAADHGERVRFGCGSVTLSSSMGHPLGVL